MALDGGSIKEANGRSQWFLSLRGVASGPGETTARRVRIQRFTC